MSAVAPLDQHDPEKPTEPFVLRAPNPAPDFYARFTVSLYPSGGGPKSHTPQEISSGVNSLVRAAVQASGRNLFWARYRPGATAVMVDISGPPSADEQQLIIKRVHEALGSLSCRVNTSFALVDIRTSGHLGQRNKPGRSRRTRGLLRVVRPARVRRA